MAAAIAAMLPRLPGKILAQEQLTLSAGIRIFMAEVVQQMKMLVQLKTVTRIVSGRTPWKSKRAQ
ncbi:MAG TPA: hypothetical protein VK794_11110 [Steroidobacteraceae bacterium]|nr:hypothetical protein [Steroidobacteraceae bacterium]